MLNSNHEFNTQISIPEKIKRRSKKKNYKISAELRHLIRESVALLGAVIQKELGQSVYKQIEEIRSEMTLLRESSIEDAYCALNALKVKLEKLNPDQRYHIAHAFTLMIQLMNTAENAYRSHRLKVNNKTKSSEIHAESITYVITAHPTEARSPQNIAVFHEIQKILIEVLATNEFEKKTQLKASQKEDLFHFLEVAWRTPVMRSRKPKVKEEAETLYAHLFRKHILTTLMNANARQVKLRIHSWIGSDKDGHPGVHEKTLIESLTLSRNEILKLVSKSLLKTRATIELMPSSELRTKLNRLLFQTKSLKIIKAKDFKRVDNFKSNLKLFFKDYKNKIGSLHPELFTIHQLLELFPGLVIPMELRESSDVLLTKPKKRKYLAIEMMLKTLAAISKGGDPRWYVHSFIISMTSSVNHIHAAAQKQKTFLGSVILPIVPLFEEADSLKKSPQIMKDVFNDHFLNSTIKQLWNSKVEMMVGYSDSSKDAGVFPSRLAIAQALPRLEKVCREHQFQPVFFHGSGGSVDRGGGTLENQTTWWPKSAVNNFKVTVQGEMVERWLASPMIASRQLEKINDCAIDVLKKKYHSPEDPDLNLFADNITQFYRAQITDPEFLQIVKQATPYAMMSYLKLGSRPAKRTQELSVKGLRAIPWILCWIQTRLLFPVWWGVGSAWEQTSSHQKKLLKQSYESNPVFNSYVNALDFTLAKVELAVFKTYVNESGLPEETILKFSSEIEAEFLKAVRFCKTLTKSNKFLESKQWLQESVQLRAPMIHPLNLLQNIAMKNKEINLLRLTVTGISSGMMSTG